LGIDKGVQIVGFQIKRLVVQDEVDFQAFDQRPVFLVADLVKTQQSSLNLKFVGQKLMG
jgi:hypothetical protein